MICKYVLDKKRTFDTVEELDDFILARERYHSKLGDIVFSEKNLNAIDHAARYGNEAAQHIARDKEGFYVRELNPDDPTNPVLKFVKFKGVTASIGKMRDPVTNDWLSPQFVQDNYFKQLYTALKEGNIGPESSKWNQKDIEMLFGSVEHALEVSQTIDFETFDREYAEKIRAKWRYQADYGNAVHDVMQAYFVGIGKSNTGESSPIRLIGNKNPDRIAGREERWNAFLNLFYKTDKNGNRVPTDKFFTAAYFSEESKGKEKLMSGQQVRNPIGLIGNEQELRKLFDIAEARYESIRAMNGLKYGDNENFTIFSEFPIVDTAKTVTLEDYLTGNQEDVALSGSIDLMIMREDGTPDIIDWKTSPEDYNINGKDQWNSAKRRTYSYQLGFYKQILGRNGFKVDGTRMMISPIIMGKINMTQTPDGKVQFSSDPINAETNAKYDFQDISSRVNETSIRMSINRIMPAMEKRADVDNDKLITEASADINTLFGDEGYPSEGFTDEQVKKEFDAYCDKSKETGKWVYYRDRAHKYPVRVGQRPIIANSPEEMYELIKEYQNDKPGRRREEILNITAAIKSILLGSDEAVITRNRSYGRELYSIIGSYTTGGWELVENQRQLNELGYIALYNRESGQIDVVCVTNVDPNRKLVMKNGGNLLTSNFYNDMVETSKGSDMLQAYSGNLEIMKAITVLNRTKLFDNGSNFIGNIRVFDTDTRSVWRAPNKQISYSFRTISRYVKDKDGKRIVKVNPNMRIASDKDMVLSYLKQIQMKQANDIEMWEKAQEKGVEYHHNEMFKNKDRQQLQFFGSDPDGDALSGFLLKENISKREMEIGYMKILDTLENAYPELFSKIGNDDFDTSGRDSEIRQLYIFASEALAELNGISLNQQNFQSDKYSQYGIKGILTKGYTSLQMSNPGMLDSDVLNSYTNAARRAYQDIRDRMQSPLAAFKDLEDRMIKANKVIGGVIMANKEHLWDEFYVKDADGNISDAMMFKHPDEISDPVKRQILHDLLTEINRYRFNTRERYDSNKKLSMGLLTEKEVWEYKNEPRFYFVPLVRSGWVDERGSLSNNGVTWAERFRSIKDTLFSIKGIKKMVSNVLASDTNVDNPKRTDNLRDDTSIFAMNDLITADIMENVDDRIKEVQRIKSEGRFRFTMNAVLSGATMAFNNIMCDEMDHVLILGKATIMHLRAQEHEMGRKYQNDIDYLIKYMKGVIKSEDLTDESLRGLEEILNDVTKASSFAVLGVSPVQITYQTMQGLFQNVSVVTKRYLGNMSFGWKEFEQASKIVYGDLFQNSKSKVALLNQLFGINDMDMNDYIKHAQDRKNIRSMEGLYKLGMMTSSRPDYYNRMLIFVAQMIKDGTWDAYEVVDGKLVYNFEKDARFSRLTDPNAPHDDLYREQLGLYNAMARQLMREGARYNQRVEYRDADGKMKVIEPGTLFEYKEGVIVPLPKSYTSQQSDGYKNIADDVYGYYTHENKAAIHLGLLGKMFMQFKTFLSGKINQYFAPGKVRMRGTYQQAQDNEGNLIFMAGFSNESLIVRRRDENGEWAFYNMDTDERLDYTEDQLIPFYQWKGEYQEGVMMTIANVIKMANENEIGFLEALREYKNNEYTKNVFRTNLRQLINDLIIWLLIGGVCASAAMDWSKEIAKDDDIDPITKSISKIMAKSLRNTALDSNVGGTLWSAFGNWTPFTFSYLTQTFKNVAGVVSGNKSVFDALCTQFSGLGQVEAIVATVVEGEEQ